MDIIRKQKTKVIAPEPEPIIKRIVENQKSLTMFYRGAIAALLISLLPMIFPHETTVAAKVVEINSEPLVFEVGDQLEYLDEVRAFAIENDFRTRHEAAVKKLKSQMKLSGALRDYLMERRSPLADFTDIILQQNNWKKIIALSNAESTLCRNYIEATANCWGVGGTDLWDMGANLGEGVVEMNHFLNTSPKKSPKKYSDMLFVEMNGLYKQPPRDHWVYNNMVIYNELIALEKSAQ